MSVTGGVEELLACSNVLSTRAASPRHAEQVLGLVSSLPQPENWTTGDMALVASYILMFNGEVEQYLGQFKWQSVVKENVESEKRVTQKLVAMPTRSMEITTIMGGVQKILNTLEKKQVKVLETPGKSSKSSKSQKKGKKGKGKESDSGDDFYIPTTTSTTTSKSMSLSGTSKSKTSAIVLQGVENGVEVLEVDSTRFAHPTSINWKDNRNSHEYETQWEVLKNCNSDEIVEKVKNRMVALLISNEYGWKVAKSVCGLDEKKIGLYGNGIESLLKEAEKLHEKLEKDKDKDDKKEDKNKLQGRPTYGRFQGTCYNCGKFGHSSRFCRASEFGNSGWNNNNNRNCFNCGQFGHTSRFCSNGNRSMGGMGQGMFQQQQQFHQRQQYQPHVQGQAQGNGAKI
jgi:hypothetical protein